MERGDVVRVDLPAPQGKPGREQIGERPAAILQATVAIANLATVVVVPFTSKQHATKFAGSVLVAKSPTNGLSVDSVALVSQLRAIDKKRVRRTDGKLSESDLAIIESKIRELLGL
jgi:mRNA interferase MazF